MNLSEAIGAVAAAVGARAPARVNQSTGADRADFGRILAEETLAQEIWRELADGKRLHQVAAAYDELSDRDEVVARLESGGFEVEILDPEREGEGEGTIVVTDPETGEAVSETELSSGVVVIERTIGEGETGTVVISADGERTTLAAGQEATREGIQGIAWLLSGGMDIERIAEALGLDREQVIAQLAAAGFGIEEGTEELPIISTSDDPSDWYRSVPSTELVDTRTGDTIASYRFDDQGGSTRTYLVDPEGIEVERTEYRSGSVVETVTDTDGREITTTTVPANDGEPIEHDVDPGETSTSIAVRYDVTVDDLELVEDDRDFDPDVIHPGDRIVIEDSVQTTVEITHNGYTLTTPPAGNLTLRREEDGLELELERDPLAALTGAMMEADPDSPEGEVVVAVVEGFLAPEFVAVLEARAEEKSQETLIAVDEYGEGEAPSTNATVENPYGVPPRDPPPSGGRWVPMFGLWLDPEVARAIAAENLAFAELGLAQATSDRDRAQLEVYARDPAYAEAMEEAGATLDGALAPLDWVWVRPEVEGTLVDAQQRLEAADAGLDRISGARDEYLSAQSLLNDAIAAQQAMPVFRPSDDGPSIVGPGYNHEEAVAEWEAGQGEVNELLYEAALHSAQGAQLFHAGVRDLLQQRLDATDPGSDEHGALEDNLEELEAIIEGAETQLALAHAYYDFYSARNDVTQIGIKRSELERRLLEEYLDRAPDPYEIGKKYGSRGRFTGREIRMFSGGQLEVVNYFENETETYQLTFAPDDTDPADSPTGGVYGRDWRTRPLSVEWNELLDPEDEDELGLFAARNGELRAGQSLHEVMEEQLGVAIPRLEDEIGDLEEELDALFEQHGPGSLQAPEDLLPDGEEPAEVTLELGGHDVDGDQEVEGGLEVEIRVAPQDQDAYEQAGVGAIADIGQPVGIEIDDEWRWVHPDVALTVIDLTLANEDLDRVERARRDARDVANEYDSRLCLPMTDTPAEWKSTAVDWNEEQALNDIWQRHFRAFHDGGYDNEFRALDAEALETTVAEALGLDVDNADSRGVFEDVTEAIHGIGGDKPEIRVVPFFYLDYETEILSALFAVRADNGDVRYVDMAGKDYGNLNSFQENNRLFAGGRLIVPEGLEMEPDEDGAIPLEVVKASKLSGWDKVDMAVSFGTNAAFVGMMFVPGGQLPATILRTAVIAGTGYLGVRTAQRQMDHIRHGGSWTDAESLMNTTLLASLGLPTVGSYSLRTAGMARRFDDVGIRQAFQATRGGVSPDPLLARRADAYVRSSDGANRTARVLDWSALSAGAVPMAANAGDLILHGDRLEGHQKAEAIFGLFTGSLGMGLGAHGLRLTRPHPRVPTTDLPEGATPVYRPDGLEALTEALGRGEISAGHHLHFIRSPDDLGNSATLSREGGVEWLYSGAVLDGGQISWPANKVSQPHAMSVTTSQHGRRIIQIDGVGRKRGRPKNFRADENTYVLVTKESRAGIGTRVREEGEVSLAVYNDSIAAWEVLAPARPPRWHGVTTRTGLIAYLQQAAPPHWVLWANAGAYAVRGTSLMMKANPSVRRFIENHPKLERSLGRTEAVTLEINIAYGMEWTVRGAVEGDYVLSLASLGYVVPNTGYAVDGHRVAKGWGSDDLLGRWALPVYTGVSAIYTLPAIREGNTDGWIGGGLFATASAQMAWRAWKTAPSALAPVPTRWDNLALGVGFGLGLWVFAWDPAERALKGPEPEEERDPADRERAEAPSEDSPSGPGGATTRDLVTVAPKIDLDTGPDLRSDLEAARLGADRNTWSHTRSPIPGRRSNPELEARGYEAVVVRPNDTLASIAAVHGRDFLAVVRLNQVHLIDPDDPSAGSPENRVWPGDTVYLPPAAPA